jgi:hypothetical protein
MMQLLYIGHELFENNFLAQGSERSQSTKVILFQPGKAKIFENFKAQHTQNN